MSSSIRAPSIGSDPLAAHDLLEDRPVVSGEDEAVDGMLVEPQSAVPVHRLRDVHQQRVRHRIAGVGQQRVDDLLGVVAGSAGVPQAERSEPVGVDVLR